MPWYGYALLAAGPLLLVFSVVSFLYNQQFVQDGVVTTATITYLHGYPKQDENRGLRWDYTIRGRFQSESGQSFEFGDSFTSSVPSNRNVGDTVKVQYLAKDPRTARLYMGNSYGDTIVLAIAGLVFCFPYYLMAFGFYWEWKEKRVLANGRTISARVVDIERHQAAADTEPYWILVAEWRDPETGKTRRFKSNVIESDPGPMQDRAVDVVIRNGNPEQYVVLTDKTPNQGNLL